MNVNSTPSFIAVPNRWYGTVILQAERSTSEWNICGTPGNQRNTLRSSCDEGFNTPGRLGTFTIYISSQEAPMNRHLKWVAEFFTICCQISTREINRVEHTGNILLKRASIRFMVESQIMVRCMTSTREFEKEPNKI